MPEFRGRFPASRPGRRLFLILLGLALWTLWACYPDPWILARNFLRYAHFPVDPKAASRIAWRLPDNPRQIEEMVRTAISYQYDWRQYGVPWYMPTPSEVMDSRRGDCESQAVVLASLLAAKHLPFQVKASFSHLWIDYPGRPRTPAENDDIAYLRRVKGRYHFRFPRLVDWAATLRTQKAALWEAIPPARRLTLYFGWALVLWLALLASARPRSSESAGALFLSESPNGGPLGRLFPPALLLGALALVVLSFWSRREFDIRALATWAMTGMGGLLASALLAARPAAWISIAPGGAHVLATLALGPLRRRRRLEVAAIAALRLRGEPETEGRFRLEAQLSSGRRVRLLDYVAQMAARKDLAALCWILGKPATLALGRKELDLPEPAGITLRERWARYPWPAIALPRPEGCPLALEEGPEAFSLSSPGLPWGDRWWLAVLLLAACGAAVSATLALLRLPAHLWTWALWLTSVSVAAFLLAFLLPRREEMLVALYGARLEITGSDIAFQALGRQETLRLRDITSVELHHRSRDSITLLVGREGLISLRGLGRPEDQEWVRATLELAILRAQERAAQLPLAPGATQPQS